MNDNGIISITDRFNQKHASMNIKKLGNIDIPPLLNIQELEFHLDNSMAFVKGTANTFLNWVKDCNYSDSIQSLGVSHVLIETRFPYYNEMAVGNYLAPDNQWEITDNAPWLNLIYKKGSVRLYKVQ